MTLTKVISVTGKNGTFTATIELSIVDRFSPSKKMELAYEYKVAGKVNVPELKFSTITMFQEKIVERQLEQSEAFLMRVLNELANREDSTKELVSKVEARGYKLA